MQVDKQYIIQAIVVAANNLRLNSEKIESVAILREHLNQAQNLSDEINRLKKITELSKLAIKLGEIHTHINNRKIDFLKLSDEFKKQSHSLVVVLSNFLDIVTPVKIRELLDSQTEIPAGTKEEPRENKELELPNDVINISSKTAGSREDKSGESEELKKQIIFDDLENEDEEEDKVSIEEFQDSILKPIKRMEMLLTKLENQSYDDIELRSYIDVMKKHAELSDQAGVKVIANMHVIFAVGLKLIVNKKLVPDSNIVECLRACLIVIVAVVKNKDVDITSYLNKAEQFGEQILQYR